MKAKKLFKSKKIINFVCGAVVVVVIAALYIFGVRSAVTRDATFVVARGDTVSGVATRLQSRDLIDSVWRCGRNNHRRARGTDRQTNQRIIVGR